MAALRFATGGDENGFQEEHPGSADWEGDIGRLRSGAHSPFVNVVGTRFGNRRLRLLPQGGKPGRERPIFF